MSSGNGFQEWKPSDLTDVTLWKPNQDVGYLYSKITALWGPGSPQLQSSPTLATAYASSQTDPTKITNTEFLTKGMADQLYGGSGGGGVPRSRHIYTNYPLYGGGDLSADRTLGVRLATPSAVGVVKPDNSSVFVSGSGVLSAVGGGGAAGLSALAFDIPGVLSVSASTIHRIMPSNKSLTPTVSTAILQDASTGGSLVADVYVNGTSYLTLTFPAGTTAVTSTPAGPIPAGAIVYMSITSVGTITPGTELSVTMNN